MYSGTKWDLFYEVGEEEGDSSGKYCTFNWAECFIGGGNCIPANTWHLNWFCIEWLYLVLIRAYKVMNDKEAFLVLALLCLPSYSEAFDLPASWVLHNWGSKCFIWEVLLVSLFLKIF